MRRPTTHGQSLPRDFARPPYLDPDTAHVVFRPARMSAEELAAGYAWCYERLFSHGSIWRPLVELTRRRHLGFRLRLSATDSGRGGTVISAGV